MEHQVVHYADGSFRIPSLPVTVEMLEKHARLFGTECVFETAEAEGFGPRTLARLRIELDSIDAERKSRFKPGVRRRRTSDETRDAVLALSVDGLSREAIEDKLGLSARSVRRYLQQTGASATTQ